MDQITTVANNAVYINDILTKAEFSTRPMHLSFMSDKASGEIYTITPETIARRTSFSNDLVGVLALSVVLALMLTAFGIWMVASIGSRLYERAKLDVAGDIARKRHKNRVLNDIVTEVRLAEVRT